MHDVELSHPMLWDGRVDVPFADVQAWGQPFTAWGLGERDVGCGDMRMGILVQEGERLEGCACC